MLIPFYVEIQDVFNRNNCATTTATTTIGGAAAAAASAANASSNSINGGAAMDDAAAKNTMGSSLLTFRLWLADMHNKVHDIPWHQLRHVKWMNKRATGQMAYVPTQVIMRLT